MLYLARVTTNKSIWQRRYEVYRRWGWFKDEILLTFRRHGTSLYDFVIEENNESLGFF
jgi:hypothetical protein